MNIGFIGLGNMGTPMAANLVRASHDVVACDIAAERAQQFVQAHAARKPSNSITQEGELTQVKADRIRLYNGLGLSHIAVVQDTGATRKPMIGWSKNRFLSAATIRLVGSITHRAKACSGSIPPSCRTTGPVPRRLRSAR